VRDLEVIHGELLKKDVSLVTGRIEAMRRNVERGIGGKEAKEEFQLLEKVAKLLEEGKEVRHGTWLGAEIELLNKHAFFTAKPMVYLVNLSARDYIRQKNKYLPALAEWLKARGTDDKMIPFSVEFETKVSKRRDCACHISHCAASPLVPTHAHAPAPRSQLLEMESDEARAKYCADNGGVKSAMPKMIRTGYHTLDLVHFFTAGEDEVRAWTIRRGTMAPKAAGTIHTDFEKFFIAAEVYAFDDFKEAGSEVAVKAAGKMRTQGKAYEVQDGDVCFFKIGKG